ncbi:DUF47 domain-containing protein [Virgibacillus soli]|uniref:DUF47 domain-containing protein n=1 Tax=Paracerasibacillus soli TaxID=480284 RepID=A0ABU5CU55_9BACI|nr:DUF47 domain-containing protein [Virgibacillus soli]MDY0409905.1 DUF47 domain-containing protein [Virgibacillus soli]
MFKKKPDKFASYLVDFANHLHETAKYFVQFKINDKETLHEFAMTIKTYESEADEKVHAIIRDLNQAFITPIEREDILQLAMRLDDIIDGMEELTALMDVYQIINSNHYIDQFTEYIYKCSEEIVTSIQMIADGKLSNIEPHVIRIKDHESKCDIIYLEALRSLFQDEQANPLQVIKYKEIYEVLEEIADHCQDVASTLQSIIMKNA